MLALPRSVLVAVDFGPASARAITVGGALAERCDASRLELLHAEARDAPAYFTPGQIEDLERQRRALMAQAGQHLTRFGRQYTAFPFSGVISDRTPVDAILDGSARADLVVMGTHGRHGPKRWWLGSVAERVLRDITQPLLIVRADGQRSATALFDRALVHSGDSLAGETTLHYARDVTACFGGETFDYRGTAVHDAVEEMRATIVVVASPPHRTGVWLSAYGEPLVRSCSVPILFVPETAMAVTA